MGDPCPSTRSSRWRGRDDRRLQILASDGRSILERRAAIDEVVRRAAIDEVVRRAAAADPDIATLWERGKAERYAGQRAALEMVMGAANLRDGVDLETAADILYAIGSPETFRILVVDRGWSGSRFEHWYGETLARLFLDPGRPTSLSDSG